MKPDNIKSDIGISPLAILAAVLFNYGKAEKVKVKMDDSEDEKDILVESIGVESDGEAAVCCIPLEKVMKYATQNYNFKFKVADGEIRLSCEKQYNRTPIYAANGQAVERESPVIEKLFEKFK